MTTGPIPVARAAALVALLAAGAYAQPPGTPAVVASPIVERTVAASQTFVGTVQPVRTATIGSAVDGRVVEFAVEEGDRVEAGQKLAQLLTETISLELAAAEAELELRSERLAELRNGSRPEEIEQARARMASAEARRRYANARRERAVAAYQTQRVISDDELDEAIALAGEAEQAYLEAKAAHDLAVAGPRAEAIAQAKAEVDMQEAVVERLSDQITKHTIISRFAGYVVAEFTEEGAWVNRGDPVAEVVAIDQVEVVAQVVEQSVAYIRPGVATDVVVPALGDRVLTGHVSVTIPRADSRSRTFPVKVLVQNEITESGPLLKPGMLARVVLPVGSKGRALMAPKDAVVLGGRSPVVFVVDGVSAAGGEGAVRPVPVTLGVASGSLIEVTGDLKPGDLVATEGNERLRPGQTVRVSRVAEPEPAPTDDA